MTQKILGLLSLSFVITLFSACSDDDNGVSYLSPEEQQLVDKQTIQIILHDYYLDSNGTLKKFTSCDTDGDGDCDTNDDCDTNSDGICDAQDDCDTDGDGDCDSDDKLENFPPIATYAQPLSDDSLSYYAILEGKQGNGDSPDDNDSIFIKYNVDYFYGYKTDDVYTANHSGTAGPIYTGKEPVWNPSFYYFDFDRYVTSQSIDIDSYNTQELAELQQYYTDNNIVDRYEIAEFIEGIQYFKAWPSSENANLNVQGVIITPSPNAKGMESYSSLGISKDYVNVFTIDLRKVKPLP